MLCYISKTEYVVQNALYLLLSYTTITFKVCDFHKEFSEAPWIAIPVHNSCFIYFLIFNFMTHS